MKLENHNGLERTINWLSPISLKGKVVGASLLVLAITLSILITILSYRSVHFYKLSFIHRGETLLGGICAESRIPLLAEDAGRLMELAKAIQARSEVLYVIYFDPNGRRICLSTKNKIISRKIREGVLGKIPKNLLKNAGNVTRCEVFRRKVPGEGIIYEFWKPVQSRIVPELGLFSNSASISGSNGGGNTSLSGIICLGLSAKEVVQITNRTIRDGLWLGLIALLTMALIAYLVLRKTMSPLDELVDGVKAVGRGDRSHLVSVSSRDELGELAREFNKMVESLKQWEQQLRDSEAQYRSLFERVQHGIVMFDRTGVILSCNPAFYRLLGYKSSQNIIGRSLASFCVDREELTHMLLEVTQKQAIHDWPLVLHGKAGERNDTLVSAVGRFDEAGRFLDAEAVVVDVTEQKSLEKQLIQAQKMEAIGTLAGGIAHDFNNILTGILGYITIIREKPVVQQDPMLKRAINVIEKSALRAADLTRQLLAFARKGKYKEAVVNINNVVGEVVRLLEETLDRRIKIIANLDKSLWKVMADEGQIYQCLLNLCLNAKDAIEGTGKIEISTHNEIVDSQQCAVGCTMPPGHYVRLDVHDDGIGMDYDTKAKIFEPFFTTKEQGKGTGLGLAMVYGIIRNHDGYIQVESSPGKGTIFRIYLVALNVDTIKAETPSALPHSTPVKKGATILVVDDESAILDLSKDILEEYKYKVITADTGEKALNILETKRDKISLILLDIMMPGMGGKETLKRIKKIYPDIPILLVTGFTADQTAQELLKGGASGIMLKPYRKEQLIKAIEDILTGKHEVNLG